MHIDMNRPIIQKAQDGRYGAYVPGNEVEIFDTWSAARDHINAMTSKVTDPIEAIVSASLREYFPDNIVESDQVTKAISLLATVLEREDYTIAQGVADEVTGG